MMTRRETTQELRTALACVDDAVRELQMARAGLPGPEEGGVGSKLVAAQDELVSLERDLLDVMAELRAS